MTSKLKRTAKIFVVIAIVTIAADQVTKVPEINPFYRGVAELLMTYGWLALIGIAVFGFVLWIVEFLKDESEPEPEPESEPEPNEPEIEVILTNVTDLQSILSELEADAHDAAVKIADANIYAEELANLIKAIALRSEEMSREAAILRDALKAIQTGDATQIAQAAGEMIDNHLRQLMFCNISTPVYWQGVGQTVAGQLGALLQWSGRYEQFVGNLLTDVSEAKARSTALLASKELAVVARPMLMMNETLNDAQNRLQMQRKIHIGLEVGRLPTVNTGLLMKG